MSHPGFWSRNKTTLVCKDDTVPAEDRQTKKIGELQRYHESSCWLDRENTFGKQEEAVPTVKAKLL